MEIGKSKCIGFGMFTNVFWVFALGVLLAVLMGIPIRLTEGWAESPSELAALLVCGIGLAYAVLSIVDWFAQRRSLLADPLPVELDLSDRSVAAERLAALKGCGILHRQARQLLHAWSAGASGPQVATMACAQMIRVQWALAAETAAILALLAATASFRTPQVVLTLSTSLMALLILVALARFQLATHLAGYVEANLVARLGNDTPAAAGIEFAQAVAKSVDQSTSRLADAQSQLAERLAKAQDDAAARLAKTLQDVSSHIAKAQESAAAQAAKVQQEAAAMAAKAQDNVAEQLGRVSGLASSIDQIFKLQQAVDGALKGVSATDEFKATLLELKRHLSESDELLRNAAKPRTIRLVEQDNA